MSHRPGHSSRYRSTRLPRPKSARGCKRGRRLYRREPTIIGFDATAGRLDDTGAGQTDQDQEEGAMLARILKRLDDDQAQAVVTIDLQGKSSIRTEVRRVGKECGSPFSSRWSPYH